MRRFSRIVTVLAVLAATPLLAEELEVVPEDSILAIVTHKTGMASGLAHNHLVAATGYDARLVFDPLAPASTRLEFRAKVADLVIDSPELNQAWYPRLEALAILSDPFKDMSEKDREKVREAMLGGKQLDVERFPDISGSILKVEPSDGDDTEFPFRVTIAFEVHGQRAEREIRGRFETTGDGVVLEAVGEFLFSDFGIKPYSAFLGAVRNRDELQLYVRLRAVPSEN